MAPVPATGMTGEFRTAAGGRVDRAKSVRFFFDGKPYNGLAGDTLATALLANGVHLMGRSFKYHRPRGPLSLGSDEPNALVDARRRQGSRHAQSARDADRALRGPEGALAKRLAVAAMGRDGGQRPGVGAVSRRLLLQDLHRPAGRLGEPLRAGDPPRGRPRRRARATRTPTITASSTGTAKSRSSAPARRASRRLWPRRGRAPASSCSTSRRNSAARCSPRRRRRSTGGAPANGSRAPSPNSRPRRA